MHRFRKKSDAKRAQAAEFQQGTSHSPLLPPLTSPTLQESLPSLPPVSDFRTSLILPDLTRRFSVLRNSSGDPIGVDDLKHKFAEQRARGAEHQVTEEEEDMILEALGRIRTSRTKHADSVNGDGNLGSTLSMNESGDGSSRISASPSLTGAQSILSTTTSASSVLPGSSSAASVSSSTKGSQYSRRMSNNLFGSGKLRDYSYVRTHRTRTESTRSSATQSDTSTSTVTSSRVQHNTSVYSDNQSLRPVTPENASGYASSIPGSPNSNVLSGSESILSSPGSSRLSKTLSPEHLRRASLALDQVIKELEEEGDDEIVMERSPITRGPSIARPLSDPDTENSPSPLPPSATDYEGGTSSSDEQIIADTDESQRSSPFPSTRATSPAQGRLPGYIPGMPRPMTPHDTSVDYDDQTPSATPRATSPRLPGVYANASSNPSTASNIYRSNSSASTSRHTPRPISPGSNANSSPVAPLILHRSTNGRYTPEDRSRNGGGTSPTTESVESPGLGRRRPVSPLSGPAFQPLASVTSTPGSRPTTPSNITWNVPPSPRQAQHARNGSVATSGHSRSESVTSFGMTTIESADMDDRPISTVNGRRVRSPGPALQDSPWIDSGRANGGFSSSSETDNRPPTAMSGLELGSPIQITNRPLRSPTPTNNGASSSYSPTSSHFAEFTNSVSSSTVNGNSSMSHSRRSSRQTGAGRHHSSFSLGSTHALLLSPFANSSHSSLESAGSSYHSWDEDHKKDRLFTLFNNLETDHSEWHDITVSVHDKTGSGSTSAPTTAAIAEAEQIVKRDIGLSKNDFIAIQERLVNVALAKTSPEGRNRAPSVRRRRPSTSQSNYSNPAADSRVASPVPQPQLTSTVTVSSPGRSSNSEHEAKFNALLSSVVNSLTAPPDDVHDAEPLQTPASPIETSLTSPAMTTPTQRHRELAKALFGVEEAEGVKNTSNVQIAITPAEIGLSSPSPVAQRADSSRTITVSRFNASAGDLTTPVSDTQTPSMPSSAHGHGQMDASLVFEVQRRAEAATAALRKSPSNPKLVDVPAGSTRKKISPNQISSPKLLSASTSVDTIPLPPSTSGPNQVPQSQGVSTSSSKLSSRFKKLRGTLRSKSQVPNGEEISPYPLDLTTPSSSQLLTFNPSKLAVPGDPAIFSAGESTQFKVSPPALPNPPASAGPTLSKGGFFSRFRKQRATDVSVPHDHPFHTPSTASSTSQSDLPSRASPQIHSAPPTKTQHFPSQPSSSSRPMSPPTIPEDAILPATSSTEEAALQQLFDAASNLGIPQDALDQILARSPSSSSRSTAWTKITRSASTAERRKSQRTATQSPALSEGRPSIDAPSTRPSPETRQLNIRKPTTDSIAARPRPDVETPTTSGANAIVRRTIIYPSDSRASNVDWNALIRKQSTSRRRRSAGAGSVQSNRSIHDRAPTPPPPKSPGGGRRFSSDESSPPVPQVPHSFIIPDISLPPGQMEKSNSAYDSLYEMYAGDSKGTAPAHPDNLTPSGPQPEGGQALEVVELANGETIWSIVNGLRDDDGESFYGDRTSFASEYSLRDNEGVKVFFKEHGRKSSKGSHSSFISRKRQTQGPIRPETKVFFSSSAQIGRLIENLSRGMDSGSFNITPDGNIQRPIGHSASSSLGSEADVRYTMEERLEQMLGSISSQPQ